MTHKHVAQLDQKCYAQGVDIRKYKSCSPVFLFQVRVVASLRRTTAGLPCQGPLLHGPAGGCVPLLPPASHHRQINQATSSQFGRAPQHQHKNCCLLWWHLRQAASPVCAAYDVKVEREAWAISPSTDVLADSLAALWCCAWVMGVGSAEGSGPSCLYFALPSKLCLAGNAALISSSF